MTAATLGGETQDWASDEPLLSAVALREQHHSLLKSHHASRKSREPLDEEMLERIEAFIRRGQAAGRWLDSDSERADVQSWLSYWTTVLLRVGREPLDGTLQTFEPTLAPELDDALCPYLGLEAFRYEDHPVFFGREELVGRLAAHLAEERLLAVVGPSGSGKSSAVLAGLLPFLKAGGLPGSEAWRYYGPIVPGADPLASLAAAFLPEGCPASEWIAGMVEKLQANPEQLSALVAEGGPAPVVVVFDQFEELFTLAADKTRRVAFTEALASLIRVPEVEHRIILSMRSEFDTEELRSTALGPLFARGLEPVTALSAAELRAAILKPAERVGLKFEDGLVNELVQQVLSEPAALPLLQFTLRKLWDMRERNRLTWAAYRRLGSARQALARTADDLYDNGLLEQERPVARAVFLHLVQPGENLEVLRRRIPRSLLHRIADPNRVDAVISKFHKARLLRLSGGEAPADQVEVAHEALIRNWPLLAGWLDEERANLRRRRRLTAAAEQWRAHHRDPGGLLGGSLLEEALAYVDLTPLEQEFLDASRTAQETARQAEQKILRDTQAANQRLRQRALWLTLAVLFAAFFAAVAHSQSAAAKKKAEEASIALKEAQAEYRRAEEEKRLRISLADRVAQQAKSDASKLKEAAKIRGQAAEAARKAEIRARRGEKAAREAEVRAKRGERAAHDAEKATKVALARLNQSVAREKELKRRAEALTYTHGFQIQAIQAQAPVAEVASEVSEATELLTEWIEPLARAGKLEVIRRAVRELEADEQLTALAQAARWMYLAGRQEGARSLWDETVRRSRTLDAENQTLALVMIAETMSSPVPRSLTDEIWRQARSQATKAKSQEAEPRVLARLLDGLARADHAADAFQVAEQASEAERPQAFAAAAVTLARNGHADTARKAATLALELSGKVEGRRQEWLLSGVATAYASLGDVAAAQKLAARLTSSPTYPRVLIEIAIAQARAGSSTDAIATLRSLPAPSPDRFATSSLVFWPDLELRLVVALIRAGATRAGLDLVANRLQVLSPYEGLSGYDREAAAQIASALAGAGKIDEAARLLISARSSRFTWLHAELAPLLARAGHVQQAMDLIGIVRDGNVRRSALFRIAAVDPGPAFLGVATLLPEPTDRVWALAGHGGMLGQKGKRAEALAVLDEALKLARQLPKFGERSAAFKAIASGLARVGGYRKPGLSLYREARLIADTCAAPDRLEAYTAILTEYLKANGMWEARMPRRVVGAEPRR